MKKSRLADWPLAKKSEMKYMVNFELDFKRNPYKGIFIVIEGIDGSGKTTQVERIARQLDEKGKKVHPTKEPTDGAIGQLIRRVLAQDVVIPSAAIQYLIAADRVVHHEEIVEHLKKGEYVISDRCFWSSVAYGLTDKKIEPGNEEYLLSALSVLSMYHQFILPDITIYLDVSVDNTLKRLSEMDKTKEIYERREKLEHIKKGYEWLVEKFPDDFMVVDGETPKEKVTEEIFNKLPKQLM